MTTTESVLASVDMANNGYVPVRYMTWQEVEVARQLIAAGVLTMSGGLVRRVDCPMEPARPAKVAQPDQHFDYEGAILDRQEAWLHSA